MVLGAAVLWYATPPCQPARGTRPTCCRSFFSTASTSHIHLVVVRRHPGAAAGSSSLEPPLRKRVNWTRVLPRASVGSAEYTVDPATDVRFQKDLQVPGCPSLLSLLGTGYREKVFAIIGVKVYAAGFYTNCSIADVLHEWKGRSSTEILENSFLFNSIFHDSGEKSLQIVLVRDVDGQTFWNALNDVLSPRIKEPSANDETALSTFRGTFEGRPLKQGTVILLSWVEPSKMLVSISSDGFPATVDAVIQSMNVTFALFDAFFGPTPVSPSLKASVANGLMILLDH